MKAFEDMTKIEQVMFKSAKNFALKLGKTEEEAIQKGYAEIDRINRISKEDADTVWVDVTTGKKHIANY
jgi:hypothetical protein